MEYKLNAAHSLLLYFLIKLKIYRDLFIQKLFVVICIWYNQRSTVYLFVKTLTDGGTDVRAI